MTLLEDLRARGILKQISNEEKFQQLIPSETAIYGGFDPTAQSLHLGNYILIATLKRFAQYGYKTYGLVGGATGMIGDPSFKDSERVLLDLEQVKNNKAKIVAQLETHGLIVVDNYNFYKEMSILTFLRDAGKLINISSMLSKDSVSRRIEKGLSFTEFSYTLLQGYDFLQLYKNNNVKVQLGGSDQWGNIVTGLDMIAKVEGDDHKAVGITFDLLTDENGNKIGKSTGGGSLWLDKEMNSPFKMYQYLLNQSDAAVGKLLKWLTFLKLDEISDILERHNNNPKEHLAQKVLAGEVVKDLFGVQEALNAKKITEILYNKNFDFSTLKIHDLVIMEDYLPLLELNENDNLVEKLIEYKFLNSKREAREFISTKALKIDELEIDETTKYQPQKFGGKYAIFKKGKKQTILLKTK